MTAPNVLVSSAAVLTKERINNPQSNRQKWEPEAWDFYDELGELRFGTTWFANVLSRARLLAATPPEVQGEEPTPIDLGPALEAVDRLAGGVGGQTQLLRSFGVHLTVPGVGYLIGHPDPEDPEASDNEVWKVYSTDEVKLTGDKWQIQTDKSTWWDLPDDSLPVKVWRPHERRHWLPDSPVRAALPICRELHRLNAHVMSSLVSRLTGAGVWVLPEGMSFPQKEENAGKDDLFLAELLDVMQTAIRDPGTAAAALPFYIQVKDDLVKEIKPPIRFGSPLDDKVIALRENAVRRLATTLDMPAEILLGLGATNHWCVDETTEILTTDGWVTHETLGVGDTVLTLNHESGVSEWQPVQDIYRAPVVDEPMVLFEGKGHSSLTTPHHRWPVLRERQRDHVPYTAREFVRSSELEVPHHILTAAPCIDQPEEPKFADDFVELVGWFWTEGSARGRACSIAQSHGRNPQYVARIRAALTRLYGPPTEPLYHLNRPAWREAIQRNDSSFGGPVTVFHLNQYATAPLLDAAPHKIVSLGFVRALTPAQLRLFTDVSEMGDGQHHRQGTSDIWQRNPAALDGYELALILSGRMTVRTEADGGSRVCAWKRTTVRPVKASIAAAPGRMVHREVRHTGTVWCPVTKNATWLARRNGRVFYTGNSSWQIEESAIKLHVIPTLELICHALTIGYLQPYLKTIGADPAIMWFDISELTVRPDKSQGALELTDRMFVGPQVAIQEAGLEEADEPTPEELRKMVGMKLLGNPMTMPTGLLLLGIEVEVQPAPPRVTETDPVTEPTPTPAPAPTPAEPTPPTQDNAPPPPGPSATLLVANEQVVRALEKAGNRVRTLRRGKLTDAQDCPPLSIHECLGGVGACGLDPVALLEGVWSRVPEVATLLDEDPRWLAESLDLYCTGLLVAGEPHTVPRLASFLDARREGART